MSNNPYCKQSTDRSVKLVIIVKFGRSSENWRFECGFADKLSVPPIEMPERPLPIL